MDYEMTICTYFASANQSNNILIYILIVINESSLSTLQGQCSYADMYLLYLFCAITYLFCLLLNVNGINFVKITANMWIIVIKKYAVDSLVSILSVKVICRNRIFSLILFHTLSTATFPHNFFVMRRDQDHHKYLSCNSHIIRVFFGKSRACLCHL